MEFVQGGETGMFKKWIAVLMLVVLMAVSFSGCFGKTKAGKTFAMPITDEPTSLDPQIAASNAERLVAANCFEGLVRIASDGTVQNGAAQSYTVSDDGLVYTFRLRPDGHWALFSGHKEILGENYKDTFDPTVYAEDFVFALQRAVDPQTGSEDAFLFSAIHGAHAILAGQADVSTLGVQATDAFTVQITLDYPDENLLYALTSPGAMPCDREFFERTAGRYGLKAGNLLCNGPFHPSRWVAESSIKLVQNEDYNGEQTVSPASVTLYYNADASAVPEKVASGTYDAAFLTKDEFDALSDTEDLSVQSLENTTCSFLFNPKNAGLANENLRKALCLAADPSKVSLLGEDVQAARGLVPPYCKIGAGAYRAADGAAAMLSYDPQAAKTCFEEALLELGATSVEIEVLCEEQNGEYVRAVVQSWQKTLGVKFVATVKAVDAQTLQAAMTDGNYTVALYPLSADSVMTSAFLERFSADTFAVDSRYTDLLAKVRASTGSFSDLRTACMAAEDHLLQHAVLLPVVWQGSYFVTNQDTKDIYYYSSKDYVYFIQATKK